MSVVDVQQASVCVLLCNSRSSTPVLTRVVDFFVLTRCLHSCCLIGGVRAVRLILLVLLSFAIPVMGYAGIGMSKTPCPMEAAAMEAQSMTGMSQQSMDADCCNDMATMLKTGKTCKVGQECKTGTLGFSAHVPHRSNPFPSAPRISARKDRPVESPAVNIWRPPA